MTLFAKAAEKTKSKSSKSKKSTTWSVGDPAEDPMARAVKQLVDLAAEEKAITAKKKVIAGTVLKLAKEHHVRDFCRLGVSPDSPMAVQNADGDKVTFVVQDRSGQYAVKEEQVDALVQLLGQDAADDLTYTELSIGFDRSMLAIPGVTEVVEKALERAITKLVKTKVMTEDQSDELVVASVKTAFKPGTLDRAAIIAGRDTTKLSALLDALGSSCIRYIKT